MPLVSVPAAQVQKWYLLIDGCHQEETEQNNRGTRPGAVGLMMSSPHFSPPEEETAKRFAQVRKFFTALLVNWKTTLLSVVMVAVCWREKFWTDPVMRFTCPLLLFLLSLPVLSYYDFSFFEYFRRRNDSRGR